VAKQVIKVSRDQIQSARALIRLSGGEENVDPMVVKIANAKRPPRPEPAAS
jgi:hypothetical protein